MKRDLLWSAWHYKISIKYRVNDKVYIEDFDVITHKNYTDVHEQFPKFIMRDVRHFFHDYDVAFMSGEIVDIEAYNW